jgi:hypothetical protein
MLRCNPERGEDESEADCRDYQLASSHRPILFALLTPV